LIIRLVSLGLEPRIELAQNPPDLDIDISVESVEHPDGFPLHFDPAKVES